MNRHSARRDLAISVLAGLLVAITLGSAATLLLRAAERQSLPSIGAEIRTGAEAVGTSVAAQIQRALGYGIPVDGLTGVDDYFADIVESVPTVEALALVDDAGSVRAETRPDVTGLEFPVEIDGVVKVTVVLSPAPPLFGAAIDKLRLMLATTAILFGFMAACVMFLVLSGHVSAARTKLVMLMRRISSGAFPAPPPPPGRGPVVEAWRAYDRCIEPLRRSVTRLEDEVATVRAIDFDGSLAEQLDPILAPVAPARSLVVRETPGGTAALGNRRFATWLAIFALGTYATSIPFVANFAIDRQWAYVPAPWWPSLPWIVECIAVCAGVAAGSRSPSIARPLVAAIGLLVTACAFAGVYWARDYGLFLELRALAGLGLGTSIAALVRSDGNMRSARIPSLPAVLIVFALIDGPVFGGLLGEAIGRRAAFLAAGCLFAALALASLAVRWNPGGRTRSPGGLTPAMDLGLLACAVALGSAVLVVFPAGPGYENYYLSGVLSAAFGIAIVLAPALPHLIAAALVVAGLAAMSYPFAHVSVFLLGALVSGAGVGGLVRLRHHETSQTIFSTAGGLALGAASVSVTEQFDLPALSGAAVLVAILAFASVRDARRPATAVAG
jgi:hypothetical protein